MLLTTCRYSHVGRVLSQIAGDSPSARLSSRGVSTNACALTEPRLSGSLPVGDSGRLFRELRLVVGRARVRLQRRLETLADRLLRDHALRDIPARGQLEHHV